MFSPIFYIFGKFWGTLIFGLRHLNHLNGFNLTLFSIDAAPNLPLMYSSLNLSLTTLILCSFITAEN